MRYLFNGGFFFLGGGGPLIFALSASQKCGRGQHLGAWPVPQNRPWIITFDMIAISVGSKSDELT